MKKLFIIFIIAAGMTQNARAVVGDELPQEKEVVIGLNDAYIPGGFDSESDAFVIANGIFPNGCYKWKRADVAHNNKLHEVKSIASVTQGMCIMVLVPFTKEIYLGKLDTGDHTIRFLNGDGTYMEKRMTIEE